jgi:leucyl aminopeptidase
MPLDIQVTRSVPRSADAVAHPFASSGSVPRALGMSRAALAAHGFEGKRGQVLVVPIGSGPTQIAIGIGDADTLDAAALRSAAAAVVRAVGSRASVATSLADLPGVDAAVAAQAIVEGAQLAAYKYHGLKSDPPKATL